jgi:L-rhamnose isomerase
VQKALLLALLEPIGRLREAEESRDFTARLALLEEQKTLPFGAVWDHYCQVNEVPMGEAWLADVQGYERRVLSKR